MYSVPHRLYRPVSQCAGLLMCAGIYGLGLTSWYSDTILVHIFLVDIIVKLHCIVFVFIIVSSNS